MKLMEWSNRDETNTPFYVDSSVNVTVEWLVENAKECVERIETNPVMDLMTTSRDKWEIYKQ